ncbi:MAG: ABC transporter permease [Polyangiales bacterium]
MRISFKRIGAVFIKEAIQAKRDRLTAAMMFMVPIMQLTLFGFAINSDPKHLPTAVHAEENTPIVRTLLSALQTSGYYDIVASVPDPAEAERALVRGDVAFIVSIPAGFTERLIRGDRPSILISADASDPAASSNAVSNAQQILTRAFAHDATGALAHLGQSAPPFNVVIHREFNPEGVTQYNIVPGLLGVILTMTLVMITAMAMTRESERGTMENLLAMPLRPIEVMIGKVLPYVVVGGVQTLVVLTVARLVFDVPFAGSFLVLLLGVTVFVVANLSLGFTFSTIARTQMQAMQLTFFFFLPSILLSGFMFPFRGMPHWAQMLGEALPLTHFLRIVRGVMLKASTVSELLGPLGALCLFTVVIVMIAMRRYRSTLD